MIVPRVASPSPVVEDRRDTADPMLVILDALESHGLPLADEAARRVHDALEDAGLLRPAVATDEAVSALRLIDQHGCTNYTKGRCWDAGRTRGAEFGADAWCDACVARAALNAAQSGGTQ